MCCRNYKNGTRMMFHAYRAKREEVTQAFRKKNTRRGEKGRTSQGKARLPRSKL